LQWWVLRALTARLVVTIMSAAAPSSAAVDAACFCHLRTQGASLWPAHQLPPPTHTHHGYPLQHVPELERDLLINIIKGISFHGELAATSSAAPATASEVPAASAGAVAAAGSAGWGGSTPLAPADVQLLTWVVRDADRLDAMGAVGIARCLTFGGFKKRPLWNPGLDPLDGVGSVSRETYLAQKASTIQHFYDKLLLLKDRLKTGSARALATHRHAYMEDFLREFFDEWEGRR
jgi:hypothetical protein